MTAWIFDVDGVITNSETKQITNPQIVEEIISLLEKGKVAFITGRSLSWLKEKVLSEIEEKVQNKDIFDNLIALCEFGGVILTYKNGILNKSKKPAFTIHKELNKEFEDLVETKFSDSMSVDSTKETIITAEVHDNFDLDKFKKEAEKLTVELSSLLDKYNLNNKLAVHIDRLGINIRYKEGNKSTAVREFLGWLEDQKVKPWRFVAFGDSRNDTEMAEELYRQNLNFEFVFVGEKEELKGLMFPFKVIFTKEHYEKGTLEYLVSNR